MGNRKYLARKNREFAGYGIPEPQLEPAKSLLIIEISCGSTAKVARLFGSNDPDVHKENEANGITITPNGVSHEYVRRSISSKNLLVHELDVDSSTAAQLRNQWSLISKDVIGTSQVTPFKLRTNSAQSIETKVEQEVDWFLDADQEIKIPMQANEKLTIGFYVSPALAS